MLLTISKKVSKKIVSSIAEKIDNKLEDITGIDSSKKTYKEIWKVIFQT